MGLLRGKFFPLSGKGLKWELPSVNPKMEDGRPRPSPPNQKSDDARTSPSVSKN